MSSETTAVVASADAQPRAVAASPDAGRELSDAFYRLVFEHATDAVLSVRLATGRIESANRRIEEMTGFALADVIGGSIALLCPEPGPAAGPEDLSPAVLDMPGLHDDLRIRRADDHPIFVSAAIAHVPDERGPLAACVLRDATERRLLEREIITKHMALRQAHEELLEVSRALEHRNRELANMSRRIATLTKQAAIGAFTAGVAHGINNPLAAVISCHRQAVKVVEGLPPGAPHERLLELLGRAHDASARIQRLVGDMRSVHRGGSPGDKPVQVDVRAELEGALSLFEHRLGGVEVVRSFASVPTVEGYPDELQHLFSNLIDNALLAMGERGRLSVAVVTVGARLLVVIEDDGPGIPKEIAARLFEPFVTTRENGTGLGLCVAQRFAHLHGGRVTAAEVVPHGARLTVELPLTRADAGPENT